MLVTALPNKISPPSSPPMAETVILPPTTFNEPVKLWLSSELSPNLVDPEANDVVI